MRRHPFLFTLSCLAVLAIAGLALFLATFDLNRYRQELEDVLEQSVGQPVRLGNARFGLSHGPALDFRDIEIGRKNGQALRARHLFVRLSWQKLLEGQLGARELVLEEPQLALVLSPGEKDGRSHPSTVPDLSILEHVSLQSCVIHNGRFSVVDRRHPGASRSLVLAGLNGRLSNLAPGKTGSLHLTARLEHEGGNTSLALAGKVEFSRPALSLRDSRCDLDLNLAHLPLTWLPPGLPPLPEGWFLRGTTTLRLQVKGTLKTGLDAVLRLDGTDTDLQLPGGRLRPHLFETLRLSGTWLPEKDRSRFQDLALQVGALEATGHVEYRQGSDGPWLAADLKIPRLPLPTVLKQFPEVGGPTADMLRKRLSAGDLNDLSLNVTGELNRLAGPEGLGLFHAQGRLEGVIFQLPRLGRLEEGAARLALNNRVFSIENGQGRFPGGELTLSGGVELPAGEEPRQDLTLTGRLDAGRLQELLGTPDKELDLEGSVACSIQLTGPPTRPQAKLDADLGELAVRYGSWFARSAGGPAELSVAGRLTRDRLAIDTAHLRLPPYESRGRGSLDFGGDRAFGVELALSGLPLTELPHQISNLAPLHPRGALSLDLQIQGKNGRVEDYRGDLTLDKVGLHLTRVIADLNKASGKIRIENGNASFSGLSARLGQSPITLSGQFRYPGSPLARLHLTAPAMRAEDVIFPSRQAVLRDLNAHLEIDRDKIVFAPVTTRLDGGTRAEVRGSVSDFGNPAVDLDITASYGNIDEVIALWRGKGKRPASSSERRKKEGRLEIRARAEKGVIGGMEFHDARGRITRRGRMLIIHPLHCRIGPGYAVGQVLVDHGEDSSPLLRISGHVEDVDAASIHQQLLHQSSLVQGKLRGDFYLEGQAGSDFLPTSFGGFNLEIRDGVLRKFRFLSKVFSLLNVSQILALKLPDMDRHGMPFQKITGNFRLDKGILSTEDLFMESNAMNLSLVGDMNLVKKRIDALLGVKPLRTVDKILTKIPLAGWLLAGDEKALITAHFAIRGPSADPEVVPVPISSVSEKVRGVFRRVFGLPGKVVEDVGDLMQGN